MEPEFIGDSFFITFRKKEYSCRAIKANDRMLYQIKFNGCTLYLTKSINQHRLPFWTSVPQDIKLISIITELGRQIEKHFN
jgi:hypothetical protein